MALVGGSIQAVSIGGTDFAVTADADAKLRLGGTKLSPQRYGNGTTIFTGSTEPWSLTDLEIGIEADRGHLQFLQSVASAFDPVPCTITLVDGTVYSGMGELVDDHDFSTAKATATISLMGSGQLTKQED
jgi:hypothetical protein